VKLSGAKSTNEVLKSLDNIPTDMLKEFFSKNDNNRSFSVGQKN